MPDPVVEPFVPETTIIICSECRRELIATRSKDLGMFFIPYHFWPLSRKRCSESNEPVDENLREVPPTA